MKKIRKKKPWIVRKERPEERFTAKQFYSKPEVERYSKSGTMERIQRRLALRALSLALPPLESRVLDAGCGNGFSLQVLKEIGFARLAGFDVSPEMVAEAKRKGFDARLGDLREIPFGDSEFDFLISVSALQWVKEKDFARVAREIRRVLAERGRAAIQFYPKSEAELRAAARAFRAAGFATEAVIDNPENAKKRRIFLLLNKV